MNFKNKFVYPQYIYYIWGNYDIIQGDIEYSILLDIIDDTRCYDFFIGTTYMINPCQFSKYHSNPINTGGLNPYKGWGRLTPPPPRKSCISKGIGLQ